MSDILGISTPNPPKVMDRLKQRIENYRKHHDDSLPRHEKTTNGHNDQQKQETQILRQRFLESKSKKSAKKSDKKDSSGSSATQKSQKRQSEELDTGGAGNGEPPSKIALCGNPNSTTSFKQQQAHQLDHQLLASGNGNNTKNKKSRNNNSRSPLGGVGSSTIHNNINMGISTNSVSTTNSSTVSSYNPSALSNRVMNIQQQQFKQEPSSDFVSLEQCMAAVDKDVALDNGGSIISNLMGEDTGDGMINSATLNDLISDLSDYPDFGFMKDFDFDDNKSDILGGGGGLIHQALQTQSVNQNSTNNNMNHFSSSSLNSNYGILSGGSGGVNNQQSHPVAPITPITPITPSSNSINSSSPRLQHVKMESPTDHSNTSHHSNPSSIDSTHGNRGGGGLSHCAGPSPATASSPLTSQLNNSSHPSQTPPYCSGSGSTGIFDSASPSTAQGHHGSSGNSTPNPNYCPPLTPNSSNNNNPGSNKATRIPYTSPAGSLATLDSPAAQTLKQMAEQHQHKAQLGISTYKPNSNSGSGSNTSPTRSPFNNESSSYYNNNNSEYNSSNNPSLVNSSGGSYSNANNVTNMGGMNNMNVVNIKQENMYNQVDVTTQQQQQQQQNNFVSGVMPSMDNLKRNQSQQRHPLQSQVQQQQQQKINPRMPNNQAALQQQQQQHHQTNKSFNTNNQAGGGSSGNQLIGSNNPASGHLANSLIGRGGIGGTGVSMGQNPSYPQQQTTPNHQSVQMNQSAASLQQQTNTSGPGLMQGSNQVGQTMGDIKNGRMTMQQQQQQQNYYYQQQQQQQQQMVHPANNQPPSNNQSQTINFTQQHIRMNTNTNPVATAGVGMGGINRLMSNTSPSPNNPMNRMTCPPQQQQRPNLPPNMMEMQQQRMIRHQQQQQQQQMRHQADGNSNSIMQQQLMAGQRRFQGPTSMQMQQQSQQSIQNNNIGGIRHQQQQQYGQQQMVGGMMQGPNSNNNMMMSNMHQQRLAASPYSTGPGVVNKILNNNNNNNNVGGSIRGPNPNMMVSAQGQQQLMPSTTNNMNSESWMSMQADGNRSFNNPMQSQMRPNLGYIQGMNPQGAQQQLGEFGSMSNNSIRGLASPQQNNMGSMGFQQQQQQQQQQMSGFQSGGMKMNQQNLNNPNSSNFGVKDSNSMAINTSISNSNNNGAMSSSPSSIMSTNNSLQVNNNISTMSSVSVGNHLNNQLIKSDVVNINSSSQVQQDFNFEMLDINNLTNGDNSTYSSNDTDFQSFDSNLNYQNILDSLSVKHFSDI